MSSPTVRVAYADDHIAVREGIIYFIHDLGGIKIIITADNGLDLITQLELALELPDVVILDVHMPKLDGFQTMEILRGKWPEIKVLILTAFEEDLYLVKMMLLGANGYLLKSCNPQNIKNALIAIHESGYYFFDSAQEKKIRRIWSGKINLPHFSENEIKFLKFCPSDLSYKEIAQKMQTTVKALEGYKYRLGEKLNIHSRMGLAIYAIQSGHIKFDMKE